MRQMRRDPASEAARATLTHTDPRAQLAQCTCFSVSLGEHSSYPNPCQERVTGPELAELMAFLDTDKPEVAARSQARGLLASPDPGRAGSSRPRAHAELRPS